MRLKFVPNECLQFSVSVLDSANSLLKRSVCHSYNSVCFRKYLTEIYGKHGKYTKNIWNPYGNIWNYWNGLRNGSVVLGQGKTKTGQHFSSQLMELGPTSCGTTGAQHYRVIATMSHGL